VHVCGGCPRAWSPLALGGGFANKMT
jgi:hypothetical protein